MVCHQSWHAGRDWSPEWLPSPFSLCGLLSVSLVRCWLSQTFSRCTQGKGICQLPSQAAQIQSNRLSGDNRS